MARPARLDGLAPVEVAGRLRHLPGLVFFDTAGHRPTAGGRLREFMVAMAAYLACFQVAAQQYYLTTDNKTPRPAN